MHLMSVSSQTRRFIRTSCSQNVEAESTLAVPSRQRQSRKDEAIRKRIEQELSRKKSGLPRARQTKKVAGTVSCLRPSQALTVKETMTVIDAAQLMAAKRCDCVLVVDEEERLCGLFTAKDITYRVVGEDKDPRTILVSEITTRNPMCVTSDTSAQDALQLMVSRGFRHLPVCNEEGDVFGLLDITQCLNEALDKMERSVAMVQNADRDGSPSPLSQPTDALAESGRPKRICSDLTSVMTPAAPVQVSAKTHVDAVAKLMKEYQTTACVVVDSRGLAGIITSKDIVLRVVASGLIAGDCSVVRVMTPRPDTCLGGQTMVEGLRKMKDGNYLHLPVVDGESMPVGLVDVLGLTGAVLEQIHTAVDDLEGPKFWADMAVPSSPSPGIESTEASAGSDRIQSGQPPTPMPTAIVPLESRSYQSGYASVSQSDLHYDNHSHSDHSTILSSQGTFTFKFDWESNVYRFRSDGIHLSALYANVFLKISGGLPVKGLTLAYLDDEDDKVIMTHDSDLVEAIAQVHKQGLDRIRLFVNCPNLPDEQSDSLSDEALTHGRQSKPRDAKLSRVLFQQKQQQQKQQKQQQQQDKEHATRKNRATYVTQEIFLPTAITFLGFVILGVFSIKTSAIRRLG
ncbi:hypothetical protein CLU79DRAFT_733009 [Phycomyces nitens]|nr:hypothetical protein CLU79DRAFT_733009 [Phycomyces nitens]